MRDDVVEFTYTLLYQREDRDGTLRDYADVLWFDTLPEARRGHEAACSGGWVRGGYRWPHVSELRTVKGGRVLADALAAAAYYCEHCRQWTCSCRRPASDAVLPDRAGL